MWLGEGSIDGKTMLVHADEGLGDSIQFARYIPLLADRGARVILVVDDPLYHLMSGMAGVSECLLRSEVVVPPTFDLHCALSSLPLAFGTRLETIPAPKSYMPQAEESRLKAWQERLGAHDKLRVGLVWSGNPNHKNDQNRSVPLSMLARILETDAEFISLQKRLRDYDREALFAEKRILDLTDHLHDFGETAALISCLDLVISVDTSVAHLAGAMGCQTWILLPYTPDYRWLLDRDDSPWYPTARLFRQNKERDWTNVLDQVRNELHALIATRSADAETTGRGGSEEPSFGAQQMRAACSTRPLNLRLSHDSN
jgi:hypothetical protein